MDTNSKRFDNLFATVATGLRRITGIHFNEMLPGTFSLGSTRLKEVSPCRIRNAFGEMVVFQPDNVVCQDTASRRMICLQPCFMDTADRSPPHILGRRQTHIF